MSTPQKRPSKPATPRQLAYLRDLALARGEAFAYPQTSAEAHCEIQRLLEDKRASAAERRREDAAVSAEMAQQRGDAAAVRPHELGGWGSSAHWA